MCHPLIKHSELRSVDLVVGSLLASERSHLVERVWLLFGRVHILGSLEFLALRRCRAKVHLDGLIQSVFRVHLLLEFQIHLLEIVLVHQKLLLEFSLDLRIHLESIFALEVLQICLVELDVAQCVLIIGRVVLEVEFVLQDVHCAKVVFQHLASASLFVS